MSTAIAANEATRLFGRTRSAVMGLLFGQPERDFYQQEVAQAAGTRLSAVQRELANLVAAGLVARRKRGNRVYYQADARSPLFTELQGIVANTTGVTAVLRRALEPLRERTAVALVFGSLAGGTARSESDVDVLVVGEVSLRDLAPLLVPVREALGREVNPVVVTPRELREKVEGRDHFLSAVLSGPKLFVIGDANDLGRLAPEGHAAPTHDDGTGDR
jgi:uncharacterized protein